MIKELKYINFGIHKDLTINPVKGINIIIGDNRQGKSTILEGITFVNWGRSNHSTVNKVINFDADKATVTLDNLFTRTRTDKQSSLSGIKKADLESSLNISYQEFLRLFYLSDQETSKLFEPAYLRKFLINLFNLDKWSIKYEQLKQEYSILTSQVQREKVNKKLVQKQIEDIVKNIKILNEEKLTTQNILTQKRDAVRKIDTFLGVLNSKIQEVQKKESLLKLNNCPLFSCSCKQIEENKTNLKLRLDKAKIEIQSLKEKAKVKLTTAARGIKNLENAIEDRNQKILSYKQTYGALKEKLEREDNINKERVQQLEKVLPIFDYKGFPSYLLKMYTPVIQETANNLLQTIFSDLNIQIQPNLSVKISNKGNETSLKDCSGSESVLVNLCLRLGVLIIYKRLNQTSIDYLLIDEGFDKFDDKVSLQLIQFLNNFIKLGYINQVFLVTHKQSLKDLDNVNYIEV